VALSTERQVFDFVVIGGGIVGLSTARALLGRHPGARLAVLEKEGGWARHQTGHNSGVIHSGIYYKPGSLKARFCLEGARALVEFCRERGIDYEVCGKIIVATEPGELPLLDALYERGLKNGLAVEKLDPTQLKEAEPHASGLAALSVPSTGIVDYTRVARAFATLVEEKGGQLLTGTAVQGVSEGGHVVEVRTNRGLIRARTLVNCAGLHSDRVARLCGVDPGTKIVPFRGEYYELRSEKRYLVKNLIYPVPNPNFPFLGVHFTRSVEACTRRLQEDRFRTERFCGGAHLPGALAAREDELAHGGRGDPPFPQQEGVRARPPEARPRGRSGRHSPDRGRREGPGAYGRGQAGGRLPDLRGRELHPRPQRALAGRHGLHTDRRRDSQAHRRKVGSTPARLLGFRARTAPERRL